MKKSVCFLALCSLSLTVVTAFLPAQTAAEMEVLLKLNAVNYGEAARFVLKAADAPVAAEGGSLPGAEDAFNFAAQRQWLPKDAESGGSASLQGVSLLIMRSFDMKGGLFYTLFKNPHYAYREMVYQDIIQGRNDPEMLVSGETLLFLINRVSSRMEEDVDYDTSFQRIPLITSNEAPQDQIREGPVVAPVAAPDQPQSSPAPAEWKEPERVVTPQQAAQQQALVDQINSQLSASAVADTTVRVTNVGVTISLSNIQFLANSAELPQSEKKKLDEIGRILSNINVRDILVAGHTALAGTADDRMKTSLERAQAVANYLISLNTRKPGEIYVEGFGADRPIADNSTPQGMALNRRVEITILENR